MIRRDYILRMIQDFMAVLGRMTSLKQGQLWGDVEALLDEQFKSLVSSGSKEVAVLSETELLARVLTGEPTIVVREKTLMLVRLLQEAGDVAAAEADVPGSRSYYLKGLHLLLQTLASGEASDWPDFVPKVESFLDRLEEHGPLPLATLAMLMQHYELVGEFARAENMLFAMLESEPQNPTLLQLGEGFYRRLERHSDAALQLGNLPRAEVEAGLETLRQRAASRE